MDVIDDAIYDALAANEDIVALVGTRIYRGTAPRGATHPLIDYFQIGGGQITETPQDSINCLYLINGVSQASAAEAEEIANAIEATLDHVTLSVADGWVNYWTAVADHLPAVELDSATGQLFWKAGQMVRVRLSK